MRIVVCAAVLLIFAVVEISAEWSSPEGSVAYRSELRTERKDVNHNIPDLLTSHEKENTQALNLDQLATKPSEEKLNKTNIPRENLLRTKGRSIIDDKKSFHNLDLKPRSERFTQLRKKKKPKAFEIPFKGDNFYENIEVGPGSIHIEQEGKGLGQFGEVKVGPDGIHVTQEGYGPPQYGHFQVEADGIHIAQEEKGPPQYANIEEGPDGIHISQEGKGPAQYATPDNDDDNKPNNGVQVEKVVILELPSDKDFVLLSKYNQQQKMHELKKRLEQYWKKEYQSNDQPDYPILDEIRYKRKKKAGQYGK